MKYLQLSICLDTHKKVFRVEDQRNFLLLSKTLLENVGLNALIFCHVDLNALIFAYCCLTHPTIQHTAQRRVVLNNDWKTQEPEAMTWLDLKHPNSPHSQGRLKFGAELLPIKAADAMQVCV